MCVYVDELILEANDGPKLKQDEIHNLNPSITNHVIELPLTIINKFFNLKKNLCPCGFAAGLLDY